uniref:Aminotransferase class V domain-containing protein n=1 Tax=Chromera velia CCMP2878 TaxID=1169474 RepID=A0A0G4FAQ6_9ALVE|eukprot:Cvel_15941.t1-p1 / transcript=Cvel_15941.t1 / gene=Cvel_15941 / organism=Chromera_velia_CCMP2878 / gene_product=hypothetical protein / transcript_product=hypothetical protein / location=Cvel_scaffold1206:14431-21936(-) / protein_length=998 / sequence_SO=supercontig / SO=protein_coding / is_pseudo=false
MEKKQGVLYGFLIMGAQVIDKKARGVGIQGIKSYPQVYDFLLAMLKWDSKASETMSKTMLDYTITFLRAWRQKRLGTDEFELLQPGPRNILYCDFTASGRALHNVENVIRDEVLPFYSNTHSETTCTSSMMNQLRAQARTSVKSFLGAGDDHAVVLTGSGSTGAISKFIGLMERRRWRVSPQDIPLVSVEPSSAGSGMEGMRSSSASRAQRIKRVVVFIADSLAHHSILLPFRVLSTRTVFSCGVWGGEGVQREQGSAYDGDEGRGVSLSYHMREIPADPQTGAMDVETFKRALRACAKMQAEEPASHVLPVCLLTAVSNVSGIEQDVRALTELAHNHGALVCWDFAAAAAHTPVEVADPGILQGLHHPPAPSADPGMRPIHLISRAFESDSGADAAFFSPHKMLGGPGTPGVLVVRRWLLSDETPAAPGGGTVSMVTRTGQRFILEEEEREEAGTPDIIGAVRLGLVCSVHLGLRGERGGGCSMRAREDAQANYLLKAWRDHPKIRLIGPSSRSLASCHPVRRSSGSSGRKMKNDGMDREAGGVGVGRLGIISFLILAPWASNGGKQRGDNARGGGSQVLFVHHQLVCALLNDVFGIQSRAGCACAGPYLLDLLEVPDQQADALADAVDLGGLGILKPGVTRVGVHFTMTDEQLRILRDSVLWVAENAELLIRAYTFLPATGQWLHRDLARQAESAVLYGEEGQWREGTSSSQLINSNRAGGLPLSPSGSPSRARGGRRRSSHCSTCSSSSLPSGHSPTAALASMGSSDSLAKHLPFDLPSLQDLLRGGRGKKQYSSNSRSRRRHTPETYAELFGAAADVLAEITSRDFSKDRPLPVLPAFARPLVWFAIPKPPKSNFNIVSPPSDPREDFPLRETPPRTRNEKTSEWPSRAIPKPHWEQPLSAYAPQPTPQSGLLDLVREDARSAPKPFNPSPRRSPSIALPGSPPRSSGSRSNQVSDPYGRGTAAAVVARRRLHAGKDEFLEGVHAPLSYYWRAY